MNTKIRFYISIIIITTHFLAKGAEDLAENSAMVVQTEYMRLIYGGDGLRFLLNNCKTDNLPSIPLTDAFTGDEIDATGYDKFFEHLIEAIENSKERVAQILKKQVALERKHYSANCKKRNNYKIWGASENFNDIYEKWTDEIITAKASQICQKYETSAKEYLRMRREHEKLYGIGSTSLFDDTKSRPITPTAPNPFLAKLSSLKNFAKDNLGYILAGTAIISYSAILFKLFKEAQYTNNEDAWFAFEESYMTPEAFVMAPLKETRATLLRAIEKRYKTDSAQALRAFMTDTKQEMKRLKNFLSWHEWLDYLMLDAILPNQKEAQHKTKTNLIKLEYMRSLFEE
jgi:hypothetical protein